MLKPYLDAKLKCQDNLTSLIDTARRSEQRWSFTQMQPQVKMVVAAPKSKVLLVLQESARSLFNVCEPPKLQTDLINL